MFGDSANLVFCHKTMLFANNETNFVKIAENFHYFAKKSPEIFGCSAESSYLCIRWGERKEAFFERIS